MDQLYISNFIYLGMIFGILAIYINRWIKLKRTTRNIAKELGGDEDTASIIVSALDETINKGEIRKLNKTINKGTVRNLKRTRVRSKRKVQKRGQAQ